MPASRLPSVTVHRPAAAAAEAPSLALWRSTESFAVAALHGPFCSRLAAGSLPRESFGAYIAQDHFFLAAFGSAYAKAASRLPASLRAKHGPAVEALVAGVEEERAGHAAAAAQWGITDIGSVAPLAATREYCALLEAAAEGGSLGVLFAAAAPCMRLYAWLGTRLKAVATPGTPYQEWLDAYASEAFEKLAAAADGLLDAWAAAAAWCLDNEPFLFAYEVAQSDQDPLTYTIIERYRSKADYLGPHRTSPAFKEFRPKMRAMQDSGKVVVSGHSYHELGTGFT